MNFRHYIKTSLLILALAVPAGCAQSRVVTDPATPYDSMGTLQEQVPVKYNVLARIFTLGLLNKRSYGDMKKILQEKLESKAIHQYGADAIANISFWPEKETDATVDYFYGRGEMIRYKKFPPESVPEPSSKTLPPAQ